MHPGPLAQTCEPSQGQLPAYARLVRTHEYQSGGQPAYGQPAHVAPACCRALGARPPPIGGSTVLADGELAPVLKPRGSMLVVSRSRNRSNG